MKLSYDQMIKFNLTEKKNGMEIILYNSFVIFIGVSGCICLVLVCKLYFRQNTMYIYLFVSDLIDIFLRKIYINVYNSLSCTGYK